MLHVTLTTKINIFLIWLDSHPNVNDPDAPLFCNLSDNIRGRAMTYDDVHKALNKILRRGNIGRHYIAKDKKWIITKNIYSHLFRHTRASILASRLPEASLESQMGWVHGSKRSATCVHLSGKQQDTAVLKAYGINVEEDRKLEKTPKKCPRCGELNPSNASQCRKC